MGEGTNRVGEPDSPEIIADEIREIRSDMGEIVSELDARRKALFDWRRQAREHSTQLAIVAGVVFVLLAGFIALRIRRHRREALPMTRLHRLRQALNRAIADPKRVARPAPSIGRKAVAAATTTLVTAAASTLANKAGLDGKGKRVHH